MNPFLIETNKPIVALCGARNGYVMIAPSQEITAFQDLPESVLIVAKAWATTLENSGSPRAYWIMLSEVTRHLHIHVFPRWAEDHLKGIALFETRETELQPAWTPAVKAALEQWAKEFNVALI